MSVIELEYIYLIGGIELLFKQDGIEVGTYSWLSGIPLRVVLVLGISPIPGAGQRPA